MCLSYVSQKSIPLVFNVAELCVDGGREVEPSFERASPASCDLLGKLAATAWHGTHGQGGWQELCTNLQRACNCLPTDIPIRWCSPCDPPL